MTFKPNYRSRPANGLGPDLNYQRLDPSNVIFCHGKYYVYYTKAPAYVNLYSGEIWYADSDDGENWTERGAVLKHGKNGAWDSFGVITPYIAEAENRFWLFYTASSEKDGEPWQVRGINNKRKIGVAVSDSPCGSFERISDSPILEPSESGWDSYLVDDTHVLYYRGRYMLYYKGGDIHVTADMTKWGVAFSDRVSGPYVKYEGNPFIDSGHTVCVWKQWDGIAALVDDAGPQKHTAQYSDDGLHFVKTEEIKPRVDTGCGPFDPYAHIETEWAEGVKWGLTAEIHCPIPFILKFEV